MTRCVIIDDEDHAIKYLSTIINEIKNLYSLDIVTTYNNSVNALQELKDNNTIDIIFIDYDMPGYNGVEFVKELNNDVSIVFVTSHSELSEDIINEVNIIGFLSKPTNKKDLEKILKKRNTNTNKKSFQTKKIAIPNGKKEDYYFNPNDIFYIESDGKYKNFYGIDEKIQKRDTFDRNPFEKNIEISFDKIIHILAPFGFEKISRNHIINIDKIRKRTNSNITLINGKELSVSETQKTGFFNKLKRIF
jgi:DNA-binding LytR/AlgR family response regulator